MFSRLSIVGILVAACVLVIGARQAPGDEADERPAATVAASPQQVRRAVERGLDFLEKDVAKWRSEHECSTCHHGVMTAWAYSEAKAQGYSIAPETFAQSTDWAKARHMQRVDKPRDTRPGWSMVNTPAIYLALLAQTVPNQGAISADELRRIGDHLLRHQEEDGSWPMKSRSHPDATPYTNPVPITYFGSAWAMLGLMRTVPKSATERASGKPADSASATEQKRTAV
jgi:hypothetical protein